MGNMHHYPINNEIQGFMLQIAGTNSRLILYYGGSIRTAFLFCFRITHKLNLLIQGEKIKLTILLMHHFNGSMIIPIS